MPRDKGRIIFIGQPILTNRHACAPSFSHVDAEGNENYTDTTLHATTITDTVLLNHNLHKVIYDIWHFSGKLYIMFYSLETVL